MHSISEVTLLLQHFQRWLKGVVSLTLDFGAFILPHILLGWIWLLACAFRTTAMTASKWFVPGIGNPLPPKDGFLLEKYEERHELSIVATMTFRGDISTKMVRGLFVNDMLQAKLQNSPKLRYPELQQYQTTFLGFPFWRADPSFQIENHIFEVFHDGPNIPEYLKTFEGMLAEFTGRPYAPQRSPWELYIIRNFDKGEGEGSPKTLAIWRAHHSQMDGFSALNLLMSLVGDASVIHVPPATALKQKELSYASKLFSMIPGARKKLSEISTNKLAKQFFVAARKEKGTPKDKVHCRFSAKLSMKKLKELSSSFGVRVPATLVTLVADSVSRVVPSNLGNVHALYAMPLGGHPGTLVNHALLSTLQLPMSKAQPITNKLMAINDTFQSLKGNPFIWLNRYIRYTLGTFPPAVYRYIAKKLMYTPISFTNFAVSSKGIQFGGMDCLEIKGGVGVPSNNTGSVVTIVGYKTDVQILFAGHDSLFSEEDATRIAAGIGESFEELIEEAAFCK